MNTCSVADTALLPTQRRKCRACSAMWRPSVIVTRAKLLGTPVCYWTPHHVAAWLVFVLGDDATYLTSVCTRSSIDGLTLSQMADEQQQQQQQQQQQRAVFDDDDDDDDDDEVSGSERDDDRDDSCRHTFEYDHLHAHAAGRRVSDLCDESTEAVLGVALVTLSRVHWPTRDGAVASDTKVRRWSWRDSTVAHGNASHHRRHRRHAVSFCCAAHDSVVW